MILQDLQRDIPKEFDFVISDNNFEVISGKQEGVYAWIAVNYILDKFGHGDDGKHFYWFCFDLTLSQTSAGLYISAEPVF